MRASTWQDNLIAIGVAKHIIMPLLAGPPRHGEHTHTSPYSLVQAGISCSCGCCHAETFQARAAIGTMMHITCGILGILLDFTE